MIHICAMQAQARGISSASRSGYAQLLASLDRAAGTEIDACLDSMETLTEPHIARELARVLPQGAHFLPLTVSSQRHSWHDERANKHLLETSFRCLGLGLACGRCKRLCCAGNGLFLGNSMPIRDMDMYGAASCSDAAVAGSSAQGEVCPASQHAGDAARSGIARGF